MTRSYSLLISKLAWSVLSPSEFAPWGEATSAKRRRRRAGIWWRFKTQRDDPVTRPALIARLGFVFNPSEIDTLLRLSPSPSWQWAGPWDKTPWRRPSPLARVLAGVGPVLLSGDLASALAGIGFENLNPSPPSRDLTNAICQSRAGAAAFRGVTTACRSVTRLLPCSGNAPGNG